MIVRASGIDVVYDDVGTGEPLLFLHGFPHSRALWTPQLTALGDRARCIVPDLRGFGGTSAAAPYSMDQYSDDAAALLDALHIERAVVCGLSMGGYIAFALWRRHRSRVRALVLADTRASADDESTRAKRTELIAAARAHGARAVADASITGMIGRSTRDKNPSLVDGMYDMLVSAPVDGIIGALEAMIARPDSTPTLATIDVPTLIIVGEEDVLTPERDARLMHHAIAGSRLEVLEGAGHASNYERPAAFNHVLSEFLAAVSLC